MPIFPQLCRNITENRLGSYSSVPLQQRKWFLNERERACFPLSKGVLSGEEKRLIEASIKTFFQLLPGVLHAPGQFQRPELDIVTIIMGLRSGRGFLGPCVLVLSDVARGWEEAEIGEVEKKKTMLKEGK